MNLSAGTAVFFALSIICFIYFLYRVLFKKEKEIYQVVILIWMPLFWISCFIGDNETVKHIVDFSQAVLLVVLLSSVFQKFQKQAKESPKSDKR